jgi:hypothetical protein
MIQIRTRSSNKQAPPLWLLKTGDEILGPVPTYVLLRGITHGRVGEGYSVREVRWSSWRALSEIREVARLRRRLARAIARGNDTTPRNASLSARIGKAVSVGEVLLFALAAACAVTRAEFGAAIEIGDSPQPPSTRCVFGDGLSELLGLPIAAHDLSLGAARAARSFSGAPDATAVHRATAARVGRAASSLEGVAMVPLGSGAELLGMLELGRVDHAFRSNDLQALQRISRLALRRIQQLRCASAS